MTFPLHPPLLLSCNREKQQMKPLDQYLDIPALIVREMQGTLSPQEHQRVREWLDEDPSHRQVYERIRHRSSALSAGNRPVAWNKNAARRRIEKTIGTPRLSIRLLRVAAAVMLPLLGIGLWLGYAQREPSRLLTAEQTIIKPGEFKARLILDNGQVFELDGNETWEDTIAMGFRRAEEGLVYTATPESSSGSIAENRLIVPRGGEFRVVLADGTEVLLNAESELRYPVCFAGNERRVILTGEAYFNVAHNRELPFVVETGGMEVTVLGTEFNVRSYPDEKNTATTLVNGKVQLKTAGADLLLFPGEQGVMNDSGELSKEPVDTYLYTAWREGIFIFRKQPLADIMDVVSRWYNVEIVFADTASRSVTFTGSVRRYEGFDQLLEMMTATGSIQYTIAQNNIIISKRTHTGE